jgi:hypothetical protein
MVAYGGGAAPPRLPARVYRRRRPISTLDFRPAGIEQQTAHGLRVSLMLGRTVRPTAGTTTALTGPRAITIMVPRAVARSE